MTLPENHKFAVLALDAEARLDGHFLEIAPGVVAFHDPPVELPEHWREWLGTIEATRLEKCRLFIMAALSTAQPGMFDHENVWLEHRVELLYRAIALASVGFHARHGLVMVGARGQAEVSVRRAYALRPIVHTPGLPPEFIVTPPQFRQAEYIARVLWDLGLHSEYRRLWRALRAFDSALHTSDLAMRLHQFVRALEGVMPIPGKLKDRRRRSQRDWFADRVALLCTGKRARDRLLAMYDTRGATEHLALPVRDLQTLSPGLSAADAEVPFAEIVFMQEALTRHALVRILTTPDLRRRFASEESMLRFWAQDDAVIRTQWGSPFPLDDYLQRFDAAPVRNEGDHVRADREHARALRAKAPSQFRAGEDL